MGVSLTTKGELIAVQLKDLIMGGGFKPGDQLPSEMQLCEKYGASRISIRSALNLLTGQGLIETRKGKGSFVCKTGNTGAENKKLIEFDEELISRVDMFEFRRIIEVESAGLAAQRTNIELIEKLREASVKMQQATEPNMMVSYDMLFHRLIATATNNSVIIKIFEIMSDAYWQMFVQNISVMGREGFREHINIVTAIETRNTELARQYMEEHLNLAMERASVLKYENL